MNPQEVRNYVLEIFNGMRVYCETSNVCKYDEETKKIVERELRPIAEICMDAIRNIRGNNEA